MALRSARERALQTVCYEVGGILVAAPVYALLFGAGAAESIGLMLAVSVAVMVWAAFHNSVFDLLEWRLAGRTASDRPHRWRVVHALSQEATSVLVTTPVIMAVGGLGLWAALALDLGLTLFYAGYAYVFHLVYDRVRPVPPVPTFRSGRAS